MCKMTFNVVDLKVGKNGRAMVMPVGDIHLGAPTCNKKLLLEKLKYCLDKKIYVLGMGDYLEMGLRGSVGDSVYMQEMNPKKQIEAIVTMFNPLVKAGLLLGCHSGN